MPLPATNRTLLELTIQTKMQQLQEEYVKVVHSAVLISIQLISTMLNQLSMKVDMEAGYQSAEFAAYCRIVLFTAIVSKPHPHVTNMLMVSLKGQ